MASALELGSAPFVAIVIVTVRFFTAISFNFCHKKRGSGYESGFTKLLNSYGQFVRKNYFGNSQK